MATPETGGSGSVLQEAARELEAAAHDAQVAFDCVALGELDRAHTNAITARATAGARGGHDNLRSGHGEEGKLPGP
jgi:hypothetical protein